MTVRVPGISQHQGDWQSGGAAQLVQDQPSAPWIRCGARRPATSCRQLLREYPGERKLRLIGSASFEPIHSVYAEGSQALLVDLHHLRGQLAKTADTVTYQAGTPSIPSMRGSTPWIACRRRLPGVIGIQTLAVRSAQAPTARAAPVRPVRRGGGPDGDAGEWG